MSGYNKIRDDLIKFFPEEETDEAEAVNALPSGDVLKLQGRDGYRLRVGSFRIIFDRMGNVIRIEEINNRGQIYK